MRLFKLCLVSLCLIVFTGTGFAQDSPDSNILSRARSFIQVSQYEKAIDLYTFYLHFHPDSVDALSQRAVAYAWLDDFSQAYRDLDQAMDMAGFSAVQQAVVHNNRGQVYFMDGNREFSLESFSRAIELDPAFPDYWINRALVYQSSQDWHKALADYQEYVTLQPDDVEAYVTISRIYVVLEDLNASAEALTAAIEASPFNPELYILRGRIYLLNRHFAKAAVDYDKWLSMINNTTTHKSLSVIEDSEKLTLAMNYGHLHHISFEAKSGDRLGIAANSTGVDSLVVLLDPKGVPVMADDDGGQGLNAFFVDFTLPDDGKYTLLVGHARGGWTGEIQLTIEIVPGQGI